jgi:hypothetical protein
MTRPSMLVAAQAAARVLYPMAEAFRLTLKSIDDKVRRGHPPDAVIKRRKRLSSANSSLNICNTQTWTDRLQPIFCAAYRAP